MNIILIDHNARLITEWQKAFAGCKDVDIKQGNILADEYDALISPANSFGFMTGGVDLAYSKLFGWDLQRNLQSIIQWEYDGELPVGCATWVPIKYQTGREAILISAPTMRTPQDVSYTLNAYLAFKAALRVAQHFTLKTIASPGLATGAGMMSYEHAALQMRKAYDDWKQPPNFASLAEASENEHNILTHPAYN